MTAAARGSCSHSWHWLLRSNADSFHRETTPIGTMEDDGTVYLLGNCRSCNSTLALELPAPEARP